MRIIGEREPGTGVESQYLGKVSTVCNTLDGQNRGVQVATKNPYAYYGVFPHSSLELVEEAPKTATEVALECKSINNIVNTMHTWWDEAEEMPMFWNPSMTEELVSIHKAKLIKPKKGIMQKLSELSYEIRKAFSKEEKALYQAGYIDQHGKWTSDALNIADKEISKKYLDDNKADFVERALEEIEMSKEEKTDCC